MVVPADAHVYATMAYGRSLFNEMVVVPARRLRRAPA